MDRVSTVFQETVNRVFLMQFSAALWNGPVAAARKEQKAVFLSSPQTCYMTSPRCKHGSVCAKTTNTLAVWPSRWAGVWNTVTMEANTCFLGACHKSLSPVTVEENMKAQKRHPHRYAFAMIFVIAWQCELISNVLKMKYWLRRWKPERSADEPFSLCCSQRAFNRCCMRFLNYRVWIIMNKGNVWSTVREAESRI